MSMVSTVYINVYVPLWYTNNNINDTPTTRTINRACQQSHSQETNLIIFTIKSAVTP